MLDVLKGWRWAVAVASVRSARDDPQDYKRRAAMPTDTGMIAAPPNVAAAAMILRHER